jgi:copper resistance protein B
MPRNVDRSIACAVALLAAGAVSRCATAQPSEAEHAAHGEHVEHGVSSSAAAQPTAPVPPLTDADRAAAFPDLGGMSHAMLEDPFNASLHVDELETQQADGADPFAWDVRAWIGHSLDRLALRTEGEIRGGETERAELQALWAHGISRWWEIVAGARADFQPTPSRNWAAFGVQGLAPYRFDVEATFFLAEGGDSTVRVEAKYELLITQRWILEPLLELEWYGQDDPTLGFASGLARSEGGLRLRYEIRREVAPYIGVTHERRIGDSADLALAAGEDDEHTRWIAGVRVRF